MVTRAQIIEEARTWAGTRWHHQASKKGVGCDCIGLIVGVARVLGIEGAAEYDACLEARGYGHIPDPTMLTIMAKRFLLPINFDDMQVADILVMRFAVEPQHFALISEAKCARIIHAYAEARRVTEHGMDALWRSRVVRAYSYRGIK
jgi:NlpC/P60 family putative phage cell wall peptidase